MNRKVIVAASIIASALLGELLIWNYVIVFSFFLVFLAYLKRRLYPIKREVPWYLGIAIGGALVEIVLVNFGQGWSYAHPDFFGIPLWIPLFWGLIGTTTIVLYEGLTE